MSFTARIITGNALGIILTVAAMALFNSKGDLLVSIAIGVVLLIVMSAILGLVSSSAFKPLAGIVAALEKAAAGDLSIRADVTGGGEFARLATAFNSMMTDMNKAMRQFFSVADTVRDSVVLVRSTTDAMASAAEDVAIQASTIATASEEMSATSGDIARNCLYAAESAQKATDQTHSGSQLVQSSSRLMENIAQRVNVSSQTVEGLGQRSDQIGAIVNTIQDIADQTNLLALNAAIEAARAGEQGRGFAVVADEVRALAERTTRATREIGEMIKAIQMETRGAVAAMGQGVKQVESGTLEATKSGEALREILEQVNDVEMQVSQIATAAEEQTATTGEISNNMLQITSVVQATAQGAHKSTAGASLMNGNAENLMAILGKFKIDESVSLVLNKAKSAHLIFTGKIKSHLDGVTRIDPNTLPTHHTCAFGKWYQGAGKDDCGHLSIFRDIDAPHAKVHDLGKQAINAFNAGDKNKAAQLCSEMVTNSEVLLEIVDRLLLECKDKH
jgi:methyl-accepting chemotaxis protein